MRLTKVSLKRLFGVGNFENVQFGFEAELQAGEKVEAVMDELNLLAENELSRLVKKKEERDSHDSMLRDW